MTTFSNLVLFLFKWVVKVSCVLILDPTMSKDHATYVFVEDNTVIVGSQDQDCISPSVDTNGRQPYTKMAAGAASDRPCILGQEQIDSTPSADVQSIGESRHPVLLPFGQLAFPEITMRVV